MKGKRVLLINSVLGYGSTGRIVEEIARTLIKEGNEVLVCFGRKNNTGSVPFYRISGKLTFLFNAFIARIFDNDGFCLKSPAKKLVGMIEKFKPDIVHIHNLHGYYINMKVLFEYLADKKIKVIWTLHDCWPFTGHCAYFDYIGCNKWKTGCYACPNKNKYPASLFIDHSKGNYSKKNELCNKLRKENLWFITPSKWLASLVRDSFLNKYNVSVINNGINLEKFCYTDNGTFDNLIDRSKKIVLGVATPFTERKGYSDFIKLAAMLPVDYQLVMVGLNEKQIQSLPDTVIGIQRTQNQTELAELYSLAYVFVNLTYEDNFPTTNIEALVCGTPVITYNTGGSIESVNTDNGLIVEKGNLMEVINAVEKIAEKDFYKYKISDEAKEKYSKEQMINRYMEKYREILSKGNSNDLYL